MIPQEILERARKIIPLKYLRGQFQDIKERNKDPFIEAWHNKDAKELLEAINYFELTREKSTFFFKLNLPAGNDGDKIAKLLSNQKVKEKEKDCYHEIINVVYDPAKNAVYAKVHTHGEEVHIPNAEHHKSFRPLRNVRYRVGKDTHIVLHIPKKVMEVKTHSGTKAIATAHAITMLTCKSLDACEPVIFDSDTLAMIDSDVRYKQATARNLNIAGTTEIVLKGDDVAKTVDHFKEKGIDLGKELVLEKAMCENRPFKFFQNGKVKVNSTIQDIFEELKNYIK